MPAPQSNNGIVDALNASANTVRKLYGEQVLRDKIASLETERDTFEARFQKLADEIEALKKDNETLRNNAATAEAPKRTKKQASE